MIHELPLSDVYLIRNKQTGDYLFRTTQTNGVPIKPVPRIYSSYIGAKQARSRLRLHNTHEIVKKEIK